MSKKPDKVSAKLGRGLAHVQSFVDDLLHGAFNMMKKAGASESKKPQPQDDSLKSKVKSGIKKTASFLGETGDSFYGKYEELNAEKRKKRQNEQQG